MAKAFDSFPHHLSAHKLTHYGFNDPLLNWMENYLTNRKQREVVNGTASNWLTVRAGVPQEATLGPLKYPLYK